MTRITDSMSSRTVLADIQDVATKMQRAQEQLSSGKQLTKPSDDPFATSRSLLYRGDLASNQQYQRNVQDAGSWQSITDTSLSQMSDYVLRARDLVVQGSSDTLGQTSRDSIANELDQLVEAIKGEGNAQYAGHYVFAGSATQTAPFTPGGADTYNGNGDSLLREIGQGVQLPVNVTGSGVVSPLIAALRQAATDLRAGGNINNLRSTDLQAIDAAQDTLSTARSVVGARTNRLDAATGRLQELQQTQMQLLSNTEDVDMAQATIDYSTQSAVYQAALKAGAMLIQPSLVNFLN